MRSWAEPRQLALLDDPIDVRFREFVAENPHVVERVIALARQWRDAGNSKCSMELLFAKLRWEHGIETSDHTFRLNDHYTSRMARHVMSLHPDLAGFFTTRLLRADKEAA